MSLLYRACLLVLIYVSTKYYQNVSNHLEVMKCTGIWLRNSFRGVNLKKDQRYCPSCMWHSYLIWYMSPPNIIKLFQTVWELWPAQDFGFRRDKYINQELSFLHANFYLTWYMYLPNIIKLQCISNSIGVKACTRFRLQGR